MVRSCGFSPSDTDTARIELVEKIPSNMHAARLSDYAFNLATVHNTILATIAYPK
jgi:hypothetical protein